MAKEPTNQKSIAFVSDWQKRSAKKQVKFNSLLVIALSIAFFTTALFFFWSKKENHDLIVDNNMKYLQICGTQEADHVESVFADGTMLISNIASRSSSMNKLLPDTSVSERLKLLVDLRLFDRIGHVSSDGTDTTLEGITNVSDREYFKRGMMGETGYDFIKSSRVTGKPCVVFYAPITEDDQINGIMIGFYETARLNNLFHLDVFSYSPNSYLMLGDGSVISNSNHDLTNENMLEFLSTCQFHGKTDYTDITQAIEDNSRTSLMFEFYENINQPSVGVITQLQNCEWMILSILPGNVTSVMINKTNHIGRILMLGVSSVFLILIVIMLVLMSYYGNHAKAEMRNTRERLIKAIEHEKKQTFIVDTLAATFSSVYLIDMDSASYERIEEQQASSLEVIASHGKWQDAVNIYVDKYVDAKYKETIQNFLDITRFDEYIGNNNSVCAEFMRSDSGWRKIFLLPAMRDENGKLLSVIFSVQRIDEEKKKELMAQNALKEAFAAAQFASNAKTTFLSNMSHDIRTPMNAIIGMTTIASSKIEDRDKVSDCLKKINSSCNHLLGLINNILDMSKIESGKVDLSEESFDLKLLIEDLVNINHVIVDEKKHDLKVNTDGLIHTNVIGDKTRL